MRLTVERIDGRLVPVCAGMSWMHLQYDSDTALLTMTCPFCGKRTLRYLVEGDEFEVNHRKNRRLEATMRRLKAHPELVAHGPVVIVLRGGP